MLGGGGGRSLAAPSALALPPQPCLQELLQGCLAWPPGGTGGVVPVSPTPLLGRKAGPGSHLRGPAGSGGAVADSAQGREWVGKGRLFAQGLLPGLGGGGCLGSGG